MRRSPKPRGGHRGGNACGDDPEGDGPIYELVGPGDSSNACSGSTECAADSSSLDFETATTHNGTGAGARHQWRSSERAFTITVLDTVLRPLPARPTTAAASIHFDTLTIGIRLRRSSGWFPRRNNEPVGLQRAGDPLAGATNHRLYNFQTQRHYYTTNSAERDMPSWRSCRSRIRTTAGGWGGGTSGRGVHLPVATSGTVPIHRLYNNISACICTRSPSTSGIRSCDYSRIWESHGISARLPVVFVAPAPQAATAAPSSQRP